MRSRHREAAPPDGAQRLRALARSSGPGWPSSAPSGRGCTSPRTTSFRRSSTRRRLEPVPPGTTGELVLTTLSKEGMPLLRYRTRDLTTLDPTPCRCGRTLVRLGRIMARSDDMLIIRGVNVYPSQVEHALLQVPELAPHYVLVVRREHALDTLEVQVESQPGAVPAGRGRRRRARRARPPPARRGPRSVGRGRHRGAEDDRAERRQGQARARSPGPVRLSRGRGRARRGPASPHRWRCRRCCARRSASARSRGSAANPQPGGSRIQTVTVDGLPRAAWLFASWSVTRKARGP